MSPVEQEGRIGIYGLNLGADPAQLVSGALTVADGVRFLEIGAVHSRGGRVKADISWPPENRVSTSPNFYSWSYEQFVAPGPVRGIAPFYDQRVWPFDGSNIPLPLPQRLNYVYKCQGQLFMNETTSSDPTVGGGGGRLTGNAFFNNEFTRAKIITYGDSAYIVDEGTAPKVLRKLNKSSQTYQTLIRYGIDRLGIVWPTAGSSEVAVTTQKPTVSTSAETVGLESGVYRFRIALENAFGKRSNGSAPAVHTSTGLSASGKVAVKWNTIFSTFPAGISKVRLYVQFTAAGTFAEQPSAYKYVGSLAAASGATGITYNYADHGDMVNREEMNYFAGAPPMLNDMCIINGIAYGASGLDVIYREFSQSEEGQYTRVFTGGPNRPPREWQYVTGSKVSSKVEIKAVPVNQSYFFVGSPNEPEYMETWYQIGNGSETIVGIAPLGTRPVIFTNQRIHVYDPETQSISTVPASIGTLSKEGLVSTERGIRFIATDGVPRLFNGATVEELASELLPIFSRDDYSGSYARFDKERSQDVCGTYGNRKFYMLYPTTGTSTQFLSTSQVTSSGSRDMAVGDDSHGRSIWSVDRNSQFETVLWLGRESRVLAIDRAGAFWFIDEGLVDYTQIGTQDIQFEVSTRRFSNGDMAQFYAIALDVDTQMETLTMACRVDGDPDLTWEFAVRTEKRATLKFNLPSYFKGRYLDLRLYRNSIIGSASTRLALYGIQVESAERGDFS